jgi:ferrochelatase
MPPRIGVLLVNIGTPDAPTPAAVRRYLAEFLSDRRVVELPPPLWRPILHGLVLRSRPARSARAYRLIWDATRDVSPLRGITEDQAMALGESLPGGVIVAHAMRYGAPAIGDQLAALQARGCDRILLAPLFPQYSGATTASAVDATGLALAAMRRQPAMRTLPAYFDAPAYISALAEDIAGAVAALDFVPDTIVASFHGMPARTAALGDPYRDQCLVTTRLLSEALGRPLTIAFQSRFGRAKWLDPSTDSVLAELPAQGSTRVAIVAPGFAADCLETLEELALRGRRIFLAAGGEAFAYLPCLNARPRGIEMLQALVLRELEGWVAAN